MKQRSIWKKYLPMPRRKKLTNITQAKVIGKIPIVHEWVSYDKLYKRSIKLTMTMSSHLFN